MSVSQTIYQLEAQLAQAKQRNNELEGIVADQNVELLELKDRLFDLEHEVVWPTSDQE